jgi:hypothetical protein
MALPQPTVAEVICENHEDFLIKYPNGALVAVQIKTRDVDQLGFKAKEAQIVKAFARFAKLEQRFPGAFSCYEFVTNHNFWKDEDTDNNLPYLLKTLHSRGGVKGLRRDHHLRGWVSIIAEEASLPEELVVRALLKCRQSNRNDTIESSRKDVLEAINECPNLCNLPLNKARKLADDLISLARAASTRSSGSSVLSLYTAGSDFPSVLAHQQLQAKRIAKLQVDALVSQASSPSVETLCADSTVTPRWGSNNLEVLYRKLERGQLETHRAVQLQDLVRSVEAMYLRWAAQFGAEEANRRIEDLRKIVRFDCAEAQVSAEKGGEPYASRMYVTLYNLLRARCSSDAEATYRCRPEHLMGTAAVLTDDCVVWWSEKFDVSGGGK